MNFSFEYELAGQVRQIVVAMDDEIVAEAQKYGSDLASLEAKAKEAADALFHRFTASSFWHNAMARIEEVGEELKAEIQEVVDFVSGKPTEDEVAEATDVEAKAVASDVQTTPPKP